MRVEFSGEDKNSILHRLVEMGSQVKRRGRDSADLSRSCRFISVSLFLNANIVMLVMLSDIDCTFSTLTSTPRMADRFFANWTLLGRSAMGA